MRCYSQFVDYAKQYRAVAIITGCLLLCISFVCAFIHPALIALLVFAAMIVAALAVFRPGIALLLLCACAGFPSLVLPLAGQHIHLVEPALALCLMTLMICRPTGRLSVSHLLALTFLGVACISFLHVPEIAGKMQGSDTYGADKRLLALCVVFGAFFCGTLLSSYVKVGGCFLLGVLFVSLPPYLVALAEVGRVPLVPWLQAAGANDPRMTQGRLWGPFPWSVNFGMYLVNLLAVALVCWLLGQSRRQRLCGAVMSLATSACIIGTGTRSAAIAAGVIALLAFAMTRHVRLLGATLLLMTTTGALFSIHIAAFFTHDESSTANRLLIWNLALKLIRTHPWLGIGLEQFHYYYAQLIVSRANELGARGIHPHQQYLEWAMESGLLWLLTGILLFVSMIIHCIQAYYCARGEQRMLPLAAVLALLANILIGFFDAPLDQLEAPTVLFLLVGLALGSRSLASGKEASAQAHYAASRARSHIFADRAVFVRSAAVSTAEQRFESVEKAFAERGAFPQLIRTAVVPGKELPARRRNWKGSPERGMRSERGAAGRSILFQLISWSIALPLIFPTTALLARYLGPVQYGEYSLTFPFLTIFALLSGTGMDPLIIRQLSNKPRAAWSEILSYALGSRLLSTLVCIVVAIITACLLPISAEQRKLFLPGSFSLLFSFSFNGARIIFSHGFRAEQRIWPLALLEAANRLLTAGLVALVVMLHFSLVWIYIVVVASDLPAFLWQARLASRRYGIHPRFSLLHLREHMLSGLPLVGHRLLGLIIGQVDLLVLTVESTAQNVGVYALASRITDPLISIAHAYVNGLYPLLCKSFSENRAQFAILYSDAVRLLLLVTVPGALIVTVEAARVVRALGGEQFSAAAGAVQILLWAMALTFLNQLAEAACTAARLELHIPLVTIVATLTNIVSNLLLIPRWQIIGASVAALTGEGVTLCLFLFLLRKYIPPLPMLGTAASILISNLPALALLHWQDNVSSPLLVIPLAIVLSIASYLVTGTLRGEDFGRLWYAHRC